MITLKELAYLTHSTLIGDPSHSISNVSDLENATSQDASFFSNPLYHQAFNQSKAGVIFVDSQPLLEKERNYLICKNPSQAFQQVIDHFYPPRLSPSGFQGIHPTAVIHETACLFHPVTIGPHAVVDEYVIIHAHTFIGAGSYIGPYTTIGQSCIIHPHVVIREFCKLAQKVIIQPGAVIGSCGFGYQTNEQGKNVKLNQVGNVVIEDEVEIGANTTIDRARFKSTHIGKESKIDNLVQIAHGVKVGTHNFIAAQVGIAGSASTGSYVMLAGQVGVVGHVHLQDKVVVSAQSGVTKSLKKGIYRGTPAIPIQEFSRHYVFAHKIEKYIHLIKSFQTRLNQIDQKETQTT